MKFLRLDPSKIHVWAYNHGGLGPWPSSRNKKELKVGVGPIRSLGPRYFRWSVHTFKKLLDHTNQIKYTPCAAFSGSILADFSNVPNERDFLTVIYWFFNAVENCMMNSFNVRSKTDRNRPYSRCQAAEKLMYHACGRVVVLMDLISTPSWFAGAKWSALN